MELALGWSSKPVVPTEILMRYEVVNATLYLRFDGDILSTNVERLREGLVPLLQNTQTTETWGRLEFDLTATKMVDSAGLNLLTGVIKTARTRGWPLRARMTSKTVHRIFLFTRLDKYVELVVQEG